MPIGTEVATSKHVEAALEFGVDVIWVGARTTVNPFSVQDIADALKGSDVTVLIKNPMNPDIELWGGAVARMRNAGIEKLGLIHRGFSAYGASLYRNNPMWHLAIEMRSRMPELPMICDPSHICGYRNYLHDVAQKSADLYYDGLILESHICPAKAWSDASQQVTPTDSKRCFGVSSGGSRRPTRPSIACVGEVAPQIDQIDAETVRAAQQPDARRRADRPRQKTEQRGDPAGRPLEQHRRPGVAQAPQLGVSEEFLKTIMEAIHLESINLQNQIMNR